MIDGSETSRELRTFLSEVDADDLARFVGECLEREPTKIRGNVRRRGFEESGFVLQDLVNEIGRRLDFNVIDGVYQGRKGVTGFDGIWMDDPAQALVIEVKTTDTYTISLDTIEKYRQELISENRISKESTVLVVVGRDDTGALEAQIRGSKHAWTMRMIGAASLVRLLQVKVNAESPEVVRRIKSLLRPIEYTRVDGIADLMFDIRADVDETIPEPPSVQGPKRDEPLSDGLVRETPQKAPSGIEAFRKRAAERLAETLGSALTRRRRSLFESADKTTHVVVSLSKRYERDYQAYWYAFYDSQRAYINGAKDGFLILGALDTERTWAVPTNVLEPLLAGINTTVRPDGQTYWHILTKLLDDDCILVTGESNLSLGRYEIRDGAAFPA